MDMNKSRYYLITGLDEGVEITPYIIDTRDSDLEFHLHSYGDMSRRYTPLSSDEVIDHMRKGIEIC